MKTEIERLAPYLDHAARDARHSEKIVHQPHQVADLTFHRLAHPNDRGVTAGRHFEQLEPRQQWSQRITQFMAQGCEEFILSPISHAQCLFGERPFL